MRRMMMTLLGAAAIATVPTASWAQSGANVGSLSCRVSGGMGFVFGSSKDLDCIFTAPGALAGNYGGPTAGAAVGAGIGANVLIGGSSKQVTLQPVSVEGSVGLNVAAGVASVTLQPAR